MSLKCFQGYLHRHEENENIAPNVQPEIREATEAESKNTKVQCLDSAYFGNF